MNERDNYFKTPAMSKLQNKRVLEEDGIRCFDLDDQENNSAMGESDLLRLSIGIGQFSRPGAGGASLLPLGEFSE